MGWSKLLRTTVVVGVAAAAVTVGALKLRDRLSRPVGRPDPDAPPRVAETLPTTGEVQTRPAMPDVADFARQAHERAARVAVEDVQLLLRAGSFQKAIDAAAVAMKEYADTPAAAELTNLRATAERELAAVRQARAQTPPPPATQTQPPPPPPAPPRGQDPAQLAQAERQARQERFRRFRDEGEQAMKAGDYAAAVAAFERALREQDDAETRLLLELAADKAAKPTLAVAEFATVGDVGIPEVGRAVAELLLSRFGQDRFQLMERTRLNAIFDEQDLTIAQVTDNPQVLRVKRLRGVRYLVVGTVSRLANLAVSARLVDVASGQIVQTAEVQAADAAGLQDSLGHLAAMLQMSDQEKGAYLEQLVRLQAEEQRRALLDEQRRREAEHFAAFQRRQRERDAYAVLADASAALARGELPRARALAAWAAVEFSDTPATRDFLGIVAAADAELARQARWTAEQRAREEEAMRQRLSRFSTWRDQGLAALRRYDYDAAESAFQKALREQEDREVRALLGQVQQRLKTPGLAVADFQAAGGAGQGGLGGSIADMMLARLAGTGSGRAPVRRDELAYLLRQRNLTPERIARDPSALLGRPLPGVRYLVIGTVDRNGQVVVSARMLDLQSGRAVQTAEASAENLRAMSGAVADLAAVLQMSDQEKQAHLTRRDYSQWLARADSAAKAGRWQEALEAYRKADAVESTRESKSGVQLAERKLAEQERARREQYDAAIALAKAAAKAEKWRDALEAYRKADAVDSTPETKAGIQLAERKLADQEREHMERYDAAIAQAKAAAKEEKWREALEAFRRADAIQSTPETKAGIQLAERRLADAERQAEGVRAQYDRAVAAAAKAAKAERWQDALVAYKQAKALQPTAEAQEGVELAERKLAEEQRALRFAYDAAIALAKAAAKQEKWQDALEAYRQAEKIDPTDEAKAGVALATRKLAEQKKEERADYLEAIAAARAAARQGNWQEALDAYRKAADIQPTAETQTGINLATRKLAEETQAKGKYQQAIEQARSAMKREDWQAAHEAIEAALSADKDGKEALKLQEELGPIVTVVALVGMKEHDGARVTINGELQKQTTPATFRLRKRQKYEIEVTVPPEGGVAYTAAKRVLTPLQDSAYTVRVVLLKTRDRASAP